MAFCKYCGNELPEDAKFCTSCGASQSDGTQKQARTENTYVPVQMPPSRTIKAGYLVWSILNILFCCLPFGIVGLVMTVIARDAVTAEEEMQKLKKAKGWNLAATITGAVAVVLYIIYCFVIAFAIAAGL